MLKTCKKGLHRYDPDSPEYHMPPSLWGRCPECRRACDALYAASEKGKATEARYNASEKGKASHARYQASEKGKASHARYEASEKGKATHARYEASEKGKATHARRCEREFKVGGMYCGMVGFTSKEREAMLSGAPK